MAFGATVNTPLHATVFTNDGRIITILGHQSGITDAIGTQPLLTVGTGIDAFLTRGLAQSRDVNDRVALPALLVVVDSFFVFRLIIIIILMITIRAYRTSTLLTRNGRHDGFCFEIATGCFGKNASLETDLTAVELFAIFMDMFANGPFQCRVFGLGQRTQVLSLQKGQELLGHDVVGKLIQCGSTIIGCFFFFLVPIITTVFQNDPLLWKAFLFHLSQTTTRGHILLLIIIIIIGIFQEIGRRRPLFRVRLVHSPGGTSLLLLVPYYVWHVGSNRLDLLVVSASTQPSQVLATSSYVWFSAPCILPCIIEGWPNIRLAFGGACKTPCRKGMNLGDRGF